MFATLPTFGQLSQPFKRAQFGLFGGKTKQYGNNVPFSKHKTRRSWLPNIQRKRLDSEALGMKVQVKVTTRALRTIKKYGGLDSYLKGTPSHKLGHTGLGLKLRIKDEEVRKQGQHLKSAAGKAEVQQRLESQSRYGVAIGALNIKMKRVANLLPEHTLEAARQARKEAGKALGLDGLASPEKTFQYLKQAQR